MMKTLSFLILAVMAIKGYSQNVFPASGNVGVGTSSPAASIDVVNSANNAGTIIRIMNLNTGNAAVAALQLNSQGGSSYLGRTSNLYSPISLANALILQEGLGDIVLQGATEIARFKHDGTVGIGTAATLGYMLAVNGSAIFTRATVKLNANWPDYVFKPAYSLPSLSSLEKYLQEHHHLPEIPTAETVAREGLDLGSGQAALLKKIEELTLYIIDQDKRLQEQARSSQSQQERLERLERLIGDKTGK